MANIQKDFESGDKGENLVKKKLEKMGYKCEFNTKDKATRQNYDIKLIECKKTIEVKNDLYAKKSGNIAIEYHNCKADKPSGLTATKAHIWCHIIDNKPYIIKVKTLKAYIKKNKPKRVVEAAGDGNADLYLYEIEQIIQAFIPIDRIEELL